MSEDFTRNDTKIIKGIAIILMFAHHLYPFKERMYNQNMKYFFHFFGKTDLEFLGIFGKICVALFFFLGGYGLYKSKNLNLFDKIKKLYIAYWKVFLVFIPIGIIFFGNQVASCKTEYIYTISKFKNLSMTDIVNNFLGISSSINGEWWFFQSYIFAILSFPIIKKIFEKKSLARNMLIIIIYSVLSENVFPAIGRLSKFGNVIYNYIYFNFLCNGAPQLSCFWMGILFAKEDLLIKLKEKIKENIGLNIISDILIISVIAYLRVIGIQTNLDFIYVPFFIIAFLDLVKRIKILEKIFLKFGKESTNMWLIHSFFCYYYLPVVKIVYYPKYAILSIIILLVLSYYSSKLLNMLWNGISASINSFKVIKN